MDTLSFLMRVLPHAPRYFAQLLRFPHGSGGPSTNGGSFPLSSREALAEFCKRATAKGWDVYISMAGFKANAKGHYANFVFSHQAHWVDLDCGEGKPYPNIQEGVRALIAFLKAHPNIPPPLMVVSGNGVHLYWPYTHDIGIDTWRQMATDLRAVIQRGGLQIDGKCSIDPVRLLRPPGTANRKDPAHPKNVYVPNVDQHNYQPLDPALLAGALAGYKQQYGIVTAPVQDSSGVAYDSDLAAGMKEPYSVAEVARRCAIVEWHTRNGGSSLKPGYPGMHNATWMAVASIYKFSVEGPDRFHEDASKYVPPPGAAPYSKRAASAMLRRTDHSGARCESLANNPFEQYLCGKCPHRGRINSPVTLGTQRVIQIQQQVVQQQQPDAATASAPGTDMFGNTVAPATANAPIPAFLIHSKYTHNQHGVAYKTTAEDGSERLFHFMSHQIVAARRLVEADNTTQYAFEFQSFDPSVREDVRHRHVIITSEQLGSRHGEIMGLLFNHQISTKQPARGNYVMGYINEWVHETLRGDNDVLAVQMGWQSDNSFVVGNQRYKDGEQVEVYLSNGLANTAEGYYTKGSLQAWQQSMRVLAEGTTVHHLQIQLGLAIAFGAPLMRYTDQQGALVSFCTGESGRGKTTVGNAMSSVWGEAKALLGSAAGDSPTHIYNTVAQVQSMPVLLDEATKADPESIGTLLNMLANGNAPGRANANGTNRRTLAWRTLGVTNTNHQISGKLSAQNRHAGSGEQARLVEFLFDRRAPLATAESRAAIKSITEQNFGHAGVAYTRVLTKYEAQIKGVVEFTYDDLMVHWVADNGERMWAATMGCLIAGLHIAKKVGIINWELDMKAFRAFLHQHLLVMRDAYNAKNAPVLTQLLDTLSAIMQKHGITLSSIRQVADGAPLGDDDMPANRMDYGIVEADSNSLPHEVYARHEPFSGLMYVRTTTFNKFAGENAFAIRQEAIRANVMERGTTTKRLTGGTMLHAVDARFDCYVFRHRDLLEQVAPPVAKSQSNVTQLSR